MGAKTGAVARDSESGHGSRSGRVGGDALILYNRNGQAALPPWELADSIYAHPHNGSSAYNESV